MSESSDLALFVASLLRDNVVHEQDEIIQRLKDQLNSSRRVEITGRNGVPVYARGSFHDGVFNAYNSSGDGYNSKVLWDVGLEMVPRSEEVPNVNNNANGDIEKTTLDLSVPMCDLAEIEIRIGGIVYATSEDQSGVSLGIRPGNVFDGGDMSRSAVCQFGNNEEQSSSSCCFLTFHLRGLPYGPWRSLRSLAMVNTSMAILRQQEQYDDDGDDEDDDHPVDIYKMMCNSLSNTQSADITSISFCAKSVRMAIEAIDRGVEFDREKQKAFNILDRA